MVNEKAFFMRGAARPLFAVLYSGSGVEGGGRDGVVICDSLFEEKFWCERVCANLARYLAEKGLFVLSFDYFGYGNSAGESEDVTVGSLVEDINFACGFLRSKGVTSLSLVGIRWGAALAWKVASGRKDISNIFLVEPVVSWKKELLRSLRTNVAGQYAIFKKVVMTREEIIDRLLSGKDCTYRGYRMNNVDGYIISKGFYEQAQEMDLENCDDETGADVIVYETGPLKEGKSSRFDVLCDRLKLRARSCTLRKLPQVNPFWTNYRVFTSTARELYEDVESVVLGGESGDERDRGNVEEVSRRTGEGGASEVAPDNDGASESGYTELDTIVNGGIKERVVTVNSHGGHMMYGVLYTPEGIDEKDLAVTFTHGGLIGMNGAFRFNTRAARRFASEGIISLCIDPHGMGRAQGRIDNVDQRVLFRRIQSGLFADDVGRAVDFLREGFPGKRITVFGVCGGAITNILAHGRYSSIDSSVLLSIPVMLSGLSHEAVRMSGGYAKFYLGMYVRKVFNPAAWLRFVTLRSEYRKIFTALGVFLGSVLKRPFSKGRRVQAKASKGEKDGSGGQNESIVRKTSAVTGSSLEFNDHFLEAFRAIVRRRSPALLVFGENDNFKWEFYSEFVDRFPDDWKAAEGIVRVEIIPQANHMYTLREWQDRIVDICMEWMEEMQSGAT